MIIVKTKLKKIPSSCTKCPFSVTDYGGRHCFVVKEDGFPKEIPYEFIKEKKNWCYVKPKWCPLVEIQDDKINVL